MNLCFLSRFARDVMNVSIIGLSMFAGVTHSENTEPVVSRKYAKSELTELKEASEKGDPEAIFYIGQAYECGLYGLRKDFSEAMKWYLKAAENGSGPAMWSIGVLYYEGKGVSRDFVESKTWWLKAAEKGNASAMFFLGAMFYRGEGVLKDSVEAYKWLILSETRGNKSASSLKSTVQRK